MAVPVASRCSESIEQALILVTPYALYHYHSGMILLSLGDDERALDELQRAMEINPSFDPIDVPLAAEAIAGLEASS